MSRILATHGALLIAVTVGLSVFAQAADDPLTPPITCANGLVGGVNCIPTKKDLKESRQAFERGVKLEKRERTEEAFSQFDQASRLNPRSPEFLAAREAVKARLVFDHIRQGNLLLAEDARLRAAAEFRAALELDPDNSFAQQRLAGATEEPTKPLASPWPAPELGAPPVRLEPSTGHATFHFTGSTEDLFKQLAAAYDMSVRFDDSVRPRQVTFNVDNVDFFTALELASKVTKSMWVALGPRQFMVADDNVTNHKHFDRVVLRTFVLPPTSTPQEANEIVNLFKSILELRNVSSGQPGKVEVRGPEWAVNACAKLLEQLDNQKPQVMLDVRVFQISHQLARDIGLHIPNTFNLFNIPAAALAGLAGQNIQQLINQLISSGGINQVGNTALSGLLAQLGGQQNSIFSQPLATFGGGLTFMGLSLDHFAAVLSVNESWARSLENLSMRAGQGTKATFHLGERYPILNASFAPIFNSPQISQVLGNQSFVPPFPSVSYEDLGLNIATTPIIQGDGSVTLQLEIGVRSLTGQSSDGIPIISNREYKGMVTLNDGEPTFIAGEISRTDTLSMSGIPGLGFIPLLNQAMVTNTKQENDDELMIAITPHVLSNFARSAPAIWLSRR